MDTVLVAVDGSPSSRAALDWTLTRAERVPTRLELVTVAGTGPTPFPLGSDVEPLYERVLTDAEEHARGTIRGIDVTTKLLRGVPQAELVRQSEGASLLVVGTDKSSRMAGLVYGTLPMRVAARAHCTVVVVPRTWEPRDSAPVLLGIGDEAPPPATLTVAAREAIARETRLELVHVWVSSPVYPMPVREQASHLHESIRGWHEEVVTEAAASVRAGFPELEVTQRLIEGPRIPHLIEQGEAAQLLVVGRRGGIFRGLVLGSAAHDVLMNPPCPVAVVPVEEHAAEEGGAAREQAE